MRDDQAGGERSSPILCGCGDANSAEGEEGGESVPEHVLRRPVRRRPVGVLTDRSSSHVYLCPAPPI